MEGRVQRQELTLLDDHYVWTSGEGLRTGGWSRGRLEGAKASPLIVAPIRSWCPSG